MANEGYYEALSFASTYLNSVQVDGAPRFRHGRLPLWITEGVNVPSAVVEARILLPTATASVTVTVPKMWRKCSPWVQCHESWFRKGNLDWHAYSDGGLCYIHNHEWADALEIIERECGEVALLPLGAALTAQLSVQLLERHLVGYRQKLKAWPTTWLAWGHGHEGTEEYRGQRDQRIAELAAAYRSSPHAIAK